MKLMKPSVWLSTIITCWKILTVVPDLIHNFSGLFVVWVLLGVFESAFMPGVIYYMSCWYRRDELGLRLAVFTSAVTLAGAFGGLLAATIANSCMARFLSESKHTFIIGRLHPDDQFFAAGERLQRRNIRKSFVNYKTWLCATCILRSVLLNLRIDVGSATPTYTFTFFTTSIVLTGKVLSYFARSWLKQHGECIREKGLDCTSVSGVYSYLMNPKLLKSSSLTFIPKLILTGIISTRIVRDMVMTIGACSTVLNMHLGTFLLSFTVLGVVSAITLHFLMQREDTHHEDGERDEVISDAKKETTCYESVEVAKRDKRDKWNGYQYII
ncbi:hypothetical protein ACEPAG_1955 [Sanghuangporus baumii]